MREQVAQLRAEGESLLNLVARVKGARAPHLPAPPVQFTIPPATQVDGEQSTNLFARFPGLKNKAPNRLTVGQVESYLKTNGRNPASLLAAYRTTGDPALLSEAMQKYPNDPQVALDASQRKNVPAEDRRQWLETFKQSDPDNALPNYLSALNYMRAGQTDQAVQELVAASGKQQFEDYSAQRIQDNEQAYLAAGYSAPEAKAIVPLQQAIIMESGSEDEAEAFAPLQSQLPQLQQIKALAVNLRDLSKSYEQAGDQASAQAALQMAVNLGQRYYTSSADGFSQLVGTAAELIALNNLNPGSPYGSNGQTVQDRINQLKDQRSAIRGLYQHAVPLLGALSEQDWSSYSDRARVFGEPAALQWVVGKYGQK